MIFNVVGGHLGGLVVEENADDFLGDVLVDESTGECVAPLVRGQLDRLPVLVAHVAGGQLAVEHVGVGVVAQGVLSARVALGPGGTGALLPPRRLMPDT